MGQQRGCVCVCVLTASKPQHTSKGQEQTTVSFTPLQSTGQLSVGWCQLGTGGKSMLSFWDS